MNKDTITITKDNYFALRMAQEELLLLEGGGVDNWTWYHESLYPKDRETLDDIEFRLRAEILGDM